MDNVSHIPVQVIQQLIPSASSELSDGYSVNEDSKISYSSSIENPDLDKNN